MHFHALETHLRKCIILIVLKFEKRRSQQVFVGHCFQTHSGSREQILFFYFSKPCISMLWKFTSENAILRGRIRTSLFPSGSRMGPQGATKGTKRKMRGRWKTPSDFLLDFMRSHQYLAFSIRIQDGVLRDNQRGKKENVWQVGKPWRLFIGFYEVVSGPRFFHQDPGWDPNGQPKGQNGKCLAGGKTLATFYWILCGRIRTSLFPSGSRMGSQGTAKWTKRKMSGRWETP